MFTLQDAKARLWPFLERSPHKIDVTGLINLLWPLARNNQSFAHKAVDALAKRDIGNDLLTRVISLYGDEIMPSLQEKWEKLDDTTEVKPTFNQFVKDHAYREAWNYVISPESAYYLGGVNEIKALPTDFFDGLVELAKKEYLIFYEGVIPVQIADNCRLEVVRPENLDITKEYKPMFLDDIEAYDFGIEATYMLASVEEIHEKVVLHWRHDSNRKRFGSATEFQCWDQAVEFCLKIRENENVMDTISTLDAERAEGMMRFKIAEYLIEDLNIF